MCTVPSQKHNVTSSKPPCRALRTSSTSQQQVRRSHPIKHTTLRTSCMPDSMRTTSFLLGASPACCGESVALLSCGEWSVLSGTLPMPDSMRTNTFLLGTLRGRAEKRKFCNAPNASNRAKENGNFTKPQWSLIITKKWKHYHSKHHCEVRHYEA